MHNRTLMIFALAWFASIIILGAIAGYYYIELQSVLQVLEKYKGCLICVNICIDYDALNKTVKWYNGTIVPFGCNLLEATQKIAVVNATYYYSQEGSFVDAINNVWNDPAKNYFWMWYRWVNGSWIYGDCAADTYILSDGEIVRWRYETPNYY
ncbi:MAG: DUF4430 domain-containing protein [Candidatus Bathycorpusculaceae bacterium]